MSVQPPTWEGKPLKDGEKLEVINGRTYLVKPPERPKYSGKRRMNTNTPSQTQAIKDELEAAVNRTRQDYIARGNTREHGGVISNGLQLNFDKNMQQADDEGTEYGGITFGGKRTRSTTVKRKRGRGIRRADKSKINNKIKRGGRAPNKTKRSTKSRKQKRPNSIKKAAPMPIRLTYF